MERKVILFDIDGTLIDCQNGHTTLTTNTKRALQALKEAGHYIFIASGRPYCYLLEELIDFDFDGYILDDGAYILFDNQELAYHPIPVKQLEPLLKQVIEKNMVAVLYGKKDAYVFQDDGSLIDYAKSFMINEKYVKYVTAVDKIKDQVLKVHIKTQNENDFKHMKINENDFYCVNDTSHLLKEIYGKTYTKATALDEILEKLHVKKENTYFFGDGHNDIEMMDAVHHAIAMDNATLEVKKHADAICKSVAQDGVADYIFYSGLFF